MTFPKVVPCRWPNKYVKKEKNGRSKDKYPQKTTEGGGTHTWDVFYMMDLLTCTITDNFFLKVLVFVPTQGCQKKKKWLCICTCTCPPPSIHTLPTEFPLFLFKNLLPLAFKVSYHHDWESGPQIHAIQKTSDQCPQRWNPKHKGNWTIRTKHEILWFLPWRHLR
jgi:hypothetical protein